MINLNKLEYLLRPTPFHALFRPLLHRLALRQWQRKHEPPAPQQVKREIIRAFAQRARLSIFVETGTFFGDMIEEVRGEFRELWSIELSASLYRKAGRRFEGIGNVHLLNGDSGEVLPGLVPKLNGPALFWLDGHFSGGVTARGEMDTPILRELAAILAGPVRDHLVLIDDARLFGSAPDYPSIAELRALLAARDRGWDLQVQDDIIRIGRPEIVNP